MILTIQIGKNIFIMNFLPLLTWVFLMYIPIVIPFPDFQANIPLTPPPSLYIGVPLPNLPTLPPCPQQSL